MRLVSARAFQLGFSLASICVAAVALVIVLDASIVEGDELNLDLSRGRDVALLLSIAFVAASAFLLLRILRSPVPATETALESSEGDGTTEEVIGDVAKAAEGQKDAVAEDGGRLRSLSKRATTSTCSPA